MMVRSLSGLLVAASLSAFANADDGASRPDFNRDIRPILANNCFPCHGPDAAHREAGLRLDLRESATKAKRTGQSVIHPGKPLDSELIRRISASDESERMPPHDTGNRLTAAQIALLGKWIEAGAPYAEHWAFVKPKRGALPGVRNQAWPKNAVDRFVLARLERDGLEPSDVADRHALIRRVSFDLRGLPPTPSEVNSFVNDGSPDAYENIVERFLADPAFGERWARLWLDLARYADSAGFGSDPLRPNAWRYRNWVIESLNRNLPFDRFSMEQLAGDLLPKPTLEQRIATAFHRNTMTNTEGGTDDEEFRVAAVKDRVDSTAQIWTGITIGCAKCHAHKFDPITHADYYRLFAIFNQSADTDQPDERPTIAAPTDRMTEACEEIDRQISALAMQLTAPSPTIVATLVVNPSLVPPPEALLLARDIARLKKKRPEAPKLPIMEELSPDKRRATHVMRKGNFLDPAETVDPGIPAILNPSKRAIANRLDLAQWLFDPDHPTTARMAVNRLWAQLWGTGIVETEEDFGTQGEPPSHPELLDWLAIEYMESGWDAKAMLRLIVTSATYPQASMVTPKALARDPRNRAFTRGPRLRLEAEMVRDQALALSGLLSQNIGGPSVFPAQPPGLWQAAFNGERTWHTSTGTDRHRRGLYTFWRRTIPYPSMATFDAPSRETCAVRRIRTNTPLQAFVTLNDPCYVEAAQALARRLMREGGDSVEDRARFGLELCLCRPASSEQIQAIVKLYEKELMHYRSVPKMAKDLATEPLGPLPESMDAVETAAWTVVANVLLNLDAVLTKG